MSLYNNSWRQEDLNTTKYAGKYVTHFNFNKRQALRELEPDYVELQPNQESELEFNEKELTVRLEISRSHAVLFYDENFEEEFVEQDHDIEDVISYFMTPEEYRFHLNNIYNQEYSEKSR